MGPQKEFLLRGIGVANITVLEPGSHGKFGGLCPDGFVYNLEVEGNNNYFADGLLVHNCHRSSAPTYRAILEHFSEAKVLGITATPDRSDQRSLGEIFQEIAFEISLPELIEQGYLAKIRVETLPLKIDLSGVGLDTRGDIDVTQAGGVVAPYLDALAAELAQRRDRKTLVFLPLVELSKRFAAAARAQGLAAEHVDGNSPDRTEVLERFSRDSTRVLSCATLLLEGWDEPSINCVCLMRPTQSRTLYVQACGRGTRPHPGKDYLLILDPLWLSSEHSLVRPANLVARNAVEAQIITEALAGNPELLGARARAKEVSLAELNARAAQLAMQLEAGSQRERQVFDALEASVTFALPEWANFDLAVTRATRCAWSACSRVRSMRSLPAVRRRAEFIGPGSPLRFCAST
jgi:superfamily II DNA or RNA helicase